MRPVRSPTGSPRAAWSARAQGGQGVAREAATSQTRWQWWGLTQQVGQQRGGGEGASEVVLRRWGAPPVTVAATSWSTGSELGVRWGLEETDEGGRWSSPREGSIGGDGLDSRRGGDGVGGRSEKKRQEGERGARFRLRSYTDGEREKRGHGIGWWLLSTRKATGEGEGGFGAASAWKRETGGEKGGPGAVNGGRHRPVADGHGSAAHARAALHRAREVGH
jgi:hypothetical protein